MNTSSIYCKTLDNVSKEDLINVVHQLTIQLAANGPRVFSERLGTDLDNVPAISAGKAIMEKAGHIGFTP